jgi:hypothetical protein
VKTAETATTFYYALAIDALVTPEAAGAVVAEPGSSGRAAPADAHNGTGGRGGRPTI